MRAGRSLPRTSTTSRMGLTWSESVFFAHNAQDYRVRSLRFVVWSSLYLLICWSFSYATIQVLTTRTVIEIRPAESQNSLTLHDLSQAHFPSTAKARLFNTSHSHLWFDGPLRCAACVSLVPGLKMLHEPCLTIYY